MSDWDNRPILPKIPKQRPPVDLVECDVCHGDFPTSEINEHAGWTYCTRCEGLAPQADPAVIRMNRQINNSAYRLARAA